MARLELAIEGANVALVLGGVLGFLEVCRVGGVGGGRFDGVAVVNLRFWICFGVHFAPEMADAPLLVVILTGRSCGKKKESYINQADGRDNLEISNNASQVRQCRLLESPCNYPKDLQPILASGTRTELCVSPHSEV